jgi:hypothetical protein
MKDWEVRHNEAKKKVGMPPYGTTQYWKNAAKVLSQHAVLGMKAETRYKLECLTRSSDPETRRIAQDALNGKRYSF